MKTNANKRSEFAKDMQNEWDNFQEKLEWAKNLWLPASLQESVNQSLRKNFENQISKIKWNPEYKEAEKTHKAEILAKVELKKAEKMEKDALIKYEKSKLQTKQKNKEYEQARIDHFGKPTEIKEDKKKRRGRYNHL